jgi:hypothetical protein
MARSTVAQIEAALLDNPKLKEQVRKLANKIVEERKLELIEEFNNHPVTMEIAAGPEAENYSGTLGRKGNLFSFIGFNEGSDPIAPVRELLEKISLSSVSARRKNGVFEFRVNIPSKEEIESVSKMPWETGRSWVYDVERAISGLSHYLWGQFNSNSRSGTGLQVEESLTTGLTFTPVRYLATLMEKFKQKLKG